MKRILFGLLLVSFAEIASADVLEKMWSGYRTNSGTEVGELVITTEMRSGVLRIEHGAYYVDYAKGIALFVTDRRRNDSDAALIMRDVNAPLGCALRMKSERSEKIIRRARDAYAAPVGNTAMTAFDLCRLVFGDDPSRYDTKKFGSDKFIAVPKTRVSGDCAEISVLVEDNAGMPTLRESYCTIAGSIVRHVGVTKTKVVRIDNMAVWRPEWIIFDNISLKKTTTVQIGNRFTDRVIGDLNDEALLKGKPRGFSW